MKTTDIIMLAALVGIVVSSVVIAWGLHWMVGCAAIFAWSLFFGISAYELAVKEDK